MVNETNASVVVCFIVYLFIYVCPSNHSTLDAVMYYATYLIPIMYRAQVQITTTITNNATPRQDYQTYCCWKTRQPGKNAKLTRNS